VKSTSTNFFTPKRLLKIKVESSYLIEEQKIDLAKQFNHFVWPGIKPKAPGQRLSVPADWRF
jgi:hypothetical protein